ncbi:MAG: 2-oxoacid:acceptor oxidoreductase family protein [Desulfurococcaceae archaeon]
MAASYEGKYVQSFPAFGLERSGAPILAFTRISDKPIELHYDT